MQAVPAANEEDEDVLTVLELSLVCCYESLPVFAGCTVQFQLCMKLRARYTDEACDWLPVHVSLHAQTACTEPEMAAQQTMQNPSSIKTT
jgi:hypothetical protein